MFLDLTFILIMYFNVNHLLVYSFIIKGFQLFSFTISSALLIILLISKFIPRSLVWAAKSIVRILPSKFIFPIANFQLDFSFNVLTYGTTPYFNFLVVEEDDLKFFLKYLQLFYQIKIFALDLLNFVWYLQVNF